MEQGDIQEPTARSAIPGLLESARLAVLRETSDHELRCLVAALGAACEAARLSAIAGVKRPDGTAGGSASALRFFRLFAALRSARFEVKRRLSTRSRLRATEARNNRRLTLRNTLFRGQPATDRLTGSPLDAR
ncbi:MAG: hypothetical protein ACK4L4_14425 [Gemmobacter sp.]